MPSVGKWLRPPRNLLIFFVLVVGVPAATLIALGVRLLDQDHALARQRQFELLDRAADQGVRLLEQDLTARMKRLSGPLCTLDDVPYDSVCIAFHPDRIEAIPPGRIPYYPLAKSLKETPSEPFQELESNEFREPVRLDKALEISRKLAASSDAAVRAGALVREARILRKLGRASDALSTYDQLSHIESVSVNHEPADLLARRSRCAVLEQQSKAEVLRREATALAADLHGGKWQLNAETFLVIDEKLHAWLGTLSESAGGDHGEPLASALAWLYEKWVADAQRQTPSSGVHVLGQHRIEIWAMENFLPNAKRN